MNEWERPNDDLDEKVIPKIKDEGFMPGEERAPWLRTAVGVLALAIIFIAFIWLMAKVIVPDDLPVMEPLAKKETTEPKSVPATKRSSDANAWIEALEKDTLEGYLLYLALFPNGDHASEAQEEIDKYDNIAWSNAEQRRTIVGYEDYLEAWPDGLHASKARELIDEMKAKRDAIAKDAAERSAQETADWERAAQANTIDGYGNYLAKHPAGKHADKAQVRIEQIRASAADNGAWQQTKAANTVSAYQQYLISFPQGIYVASAIAAIEKLRPAPGKTFKDCEVCPLMVSLPISTVNLGAHQGDAVARPNEKPSRPVTFSNMFAIGVTEVTFTQWAACVGSNGCKPISNDNGWGRGVRPVININWQDAQDYTAWLSQKTGFAYSLPSEAQWEYAARGGDEGIWVGGSKAALCAFANGAGMESGFKWGNSACLDPASDRTLPVGTLGANAFGVKDIIGNVGEWTLDCNTLNLRDAPTDGSADLRGSCNQRATRGGSWFSGPMDLRFTSRLLQRRGDRNDFTGFRVVRKIEK